jgi:hypothetical protein
MAFVARITQVSFVEPAVLGPATDDTEIPTTGLQPSYIYIYIYHILKFLKSIVIWVSFFSNRGNEPVELLPFPKAMGSRRKK